MLIIWTTLYARHITSREWSKALPINPLWCVCILCWLTHSSHPTFSVIDVNRCLVIESSQGSCKKSFPPLLWVLIRTLCIAVYVIPQIYPFIHSFSLFLYLIISTPCTRIDSMYFGCISKRQSVTPIQPTVMSHNSCDLKYLSYFLWPLLYLEYLSYFVL